MLINKHTIIKGKNVILVPYREEHVPKYHKWMSSKELQHLTASEPLSLEQEYEMQESWRNDKDKCTFIILHREKYESSCNEVDAMIGDTNLFLTTLEEPLSAEAEIMIAEPWARGKKCGWEAMLLMFIYGIKFIGIKQYTAKISFDNSPSINMFMKMGFDEVSRSEVFQEITFCKEVDEEWYKWIETSLEKYEIEDKSKDS